MYSSCLVGSVGQSPSTSWPPPPNSQSPTHTGEWLALWPITSVTLPPNTLQNNLECSLGLRCTIPDNKSHFKWVQFHWGTFCPKDSTVRSLDAQMASFLSAPSSSKCEPTKNSKKVWQNIIWKVSQDNFDEGAREKNGSGQASRAARSPQRNPHAHKIVHKLKFGEVKGTR